MSGTYKMTKPLVVNQYEIVQGVDGKDYLFFWGGFLSQWADSNFAIENITYNCAEQYMMAEKARLFKDENMLRKILTTTDPSQQKKYGRQVRNFDKNEWDAIAQDVVYDASMAKFTQNKHLKEQLLDTGDAILVEASPYDDVWGIKMFVDHPDILDPSKWKGKNWLGIACTKARESIRKDEN